MKRYQMEDLLKETDLNDTNGLVPAMVFLVVVFAFVFCIHEDGLLYMVSTPEIERSPSRSIGWVIDAFILYFLIYIIQKLDNLRAAAKEFIATQNETRDVD